MNHRSLPNIWLLFIFSLGVSIFSNQAHGDFSGSKGFSVKQGSPKVYPFEVTGTSKSFTLYFTADYACQAVVAAESQIAGFQSGGGISSVYASFDGAFGIKSFNLPPGRYFFGVRTTSATAFLCSYELEYFPVDPESEFVQTVKTDVQTLSAGRRLIQPFTVSAGSYYVIDGNNTGLEYYLIPASEFDRFLNDQTFSYIPNYSGGENSIDHNMPGLFVMKNLAPGEYGLAFRNTSGKPAALTYGLYRYATAGGGGGSVTIDGATSWQVSGSTIDISAAKISNTRTGGVSGTLRLQIWATTGAFTGESISGYILGTRSLGTLAGGQSFNSISGAVSYTAPPAGTYYTTMTLEEYDGTSYSIIDYKNFTGTTNFGVTVGVPDISIEHPVGVNLADNGGVINYGSTNIGSGGTPKTFTIRNSGNASLTGISVSKDGANSSDFTINTSGMLTTLAAGGSTSFTVTFNPSLQGSRSAALHIASNDPDESPFDINITGTGTAVLSDISTLSGLTVNSGTLSPAFAPGITSYSVNVSNAIASINITPVTTSNTATIKVNGINVLSGSPSAAIPLTVGSNSITTVVTAQNGTTTSYILNATRAPSPNIDLATALDNSALTWTVGGNGSWTGQSTVTHDMIDAARSGSITDNQESWLQTTVTGPGNLTFWWKVSSEDRYDEFQFLIDSTPQTNRISGETGWQQETITVASGTHVLRWRYSKDGSLSAGQDAAWLDQVAWTPSNSTTPYTIWQTGFFNPTQLTNPAISGDDADFDNDGINNLLEFVLGGSPTAADSNLLKSATTTPAPSGRNLVFFYDRKIAANGITQVIETSPTLTGIWTPAVHGTNNVTITTTTLDANTQRITATIPSTETKLFVRLKASR